MVKDVKCFEKLRLRVRRAKKLAVGEHPRLQGVGFFIKQARDQRSVVELPPLRTDKGTMRIATTMPIRCSTLEIGPAKGLDELLRPYTGREDRCAITVAAKSANAFASDRPAR